MSSVIQAYNAKVTQVHGTKKIGKPRWPIYYGAELEYEVKTPSTYRTKEEMHILRTSVGEAIKPTISSFAFTKHDGSLKNGFEVVTVPMSLDSHHAYWNDFFHHSKNKGLEVKASCGMHVHASREILTSFQIGKMLIFIFSPENHKFIVDIAGRQPPQQYAEMNPKKIGDVSRHVNRYSALNLSGHETIEFRLFKGTLSKEQALKNVEFCDALIHFTWPSLVGLRELKNNGVELFSQFVKDNKQTYPYLYKFLIHKKYIKIPKKSGGRVLVKRPPQTKKSGESSLIGFLERLNTPLDLSFNDDNEDYE